MDNIISTIFLGIAVFMVLAFPFYLIIEKIRITKKYRQREESIKSTIGENFKRYKFGAPNNITFMISDGGNIAIMPAQLQQEVKYFKFNDITGYSVTVDDKTTDGVKEAIVGGFLFGGLGAIRAYHSAKSTDNNTLALTLHFDSLEESIFILDFSNYIESSSNSYENKIKAMNELIERFKCLERNTLILE